MSTHSELCERAAAWLSGTMRCQPVLYGVASAGEIPDAIGWSSKYKFRGSIVVECKASKSDFYADKKKRIEYRHKQHGFTYPARRISAKGAIAEQFEVVAVPLIGRFRYYMSAPGIVTPQMVTEHAPDHGLLHVEGRRVRVALPAPQRDDADLHAEIRYMRFALIHVEDNLRSAGCGVHMPTLARWDGVKGIELPETRERNDVSRNAPLFSGETQL